MKDKLLHPATVISLIALFVALSGTSYAISQLPKNSVGNKQLKKNAVTADKVKDRSLLAKDFKAGQLPKGAKGDAGPNGAAGPSGAAGPTGSRGPSDGYVGNRNPTPLLDLTASFQTVTTSQQLPAGSYIAVARVNLVSGGASGIICSFGDDAVQSLNLGAGTQMPLTLASGFKLNEAGKITAGCQRVSGSVSVAQASVVATRVESLAVETTN